MTTWETSPSGPPFEDFDELATALIDALGTLFRSLTEPEHGRAVVQITCQLVNDCADLLFQLRDGNGRPATRTARAQIENLVNLATVMASDDASLRYTDHSEVVAHLVEQYRSLHYDDLDDRGDAAARLAELRKRCDSVLQRHGSSFRHRWAGKSIAKRVASHGLSSYADYYELSSMVVHNSTGGTRGTLRPIRDLAVYRVGPALELCPDAYLEGLSATREACRRLGSLIDARLTEVPMSIIDLLLQSHGEYVRFILDLDNALWPEEPPAGLVAVRAVARSGRVRWYSWDQAAGTLREAWPPADEQFDFSSLDTSIAELWKTMPPDQRWITTQIAGQVVQPMPGAPSIPDSAVLQPPDGPAEVHAREVGSVERRPPRTGA